MLMLHPLLARTVSTSLSLVHDGMLCMEIHRLFDMRMQEISSALLGRSWTDKQSIEWLLLGKMEDGGGREKAGRFSHRFFHEHQTLAPRKAPESVQKDHSFSSVHSVSRTGVVCDELFLTNMCLFEQNWEKIWTIRLRGFLRISSREVAPERT